MSYEPPTPSASLPTETVNTLNESTPERLRDVATYAEALAEHKEREARLEEEVDQDEVAERRDDLPDDVPTKAAITIKRSTTIATTTGSGGTVIRFDLGTKDQSSPTAEADREHSALAPILFGRERGGDNRFSSVDFWSNP